MSASLLFNPGPAHFIEANSITDVNARVSHGLVDIERAIDVARSFNNATRLARLNGVYADLCIRASTVCRQSLSSVIAFAQDIRDDAATAIAVQD